MAPQCRCRFALDILSCISFVIIVIETIRIWAFNAYFIDMANAMPSPMSSVIRVARPGSQKRSLLAEVLLYILIPEHNLHHHHHHHSSSPGMHKRETLNHNNMSWVWAQLSDIRRVFLSLLFQVLQEQRCSPLYLGIHCMVAHMSSCGLGPGWKHPAFFRHCVFVLKGNLFFFAFAVLVFLGSFRCDTMFHQFPYPCQVPFPDVNVTWRFFWAWHFTFHTNFGNVPVNVYVFFFNATASPVLRPKYPVKATMTFSLAPQVWPRKFSHWPQSPADSAGAWPSSLPFLMTTCQGTWANSKRPILNANIRNSHVQKVILITKSDEFKQNWSAKFLTSEVVAQSMTALRSGLFVWLHAGGCNRQFTVVGSQERVQQESLKGWPLGSIF